MNGQESKWLRHPFVAVTGLVASLLGIVTFVTGKAHLAEFFPSGDVSVDHYVVRNCGAIKDTGSGLEWFVGPDRTMSWYEAEDWVRNLDACEGGWRMPTAAELKSIYDPSRTAGRGYFTAGNRWPAHIHPVFDAIGEGSWAWAADSPKRNKAVSFNFNQGIATTYSPENNEYTTRAFAVRQTR